MAYSAESLEPGADELKEMMIEKAHELFSVCDTEQKGFINKKDMQRLQAELPLSPEQLEAVFDSLDDDGNGFLTLEEFTEGFGSFLGLPTSDAATDDVTEQVYEHNREVHDVDPEQQREFTEVVDKLDATGVLDDVDVVRALWGRLRRDEPELLPHFEDFLSRVSGELRRTQSDYQTLEAALRTKSQSHDEEVRKLYEEMENQLKLERERIVAEEKARERQFRDDLEKELRDKDRILQDLMSKHHDLEDRLKMLNTNESETKQENEKLQRERDELEAELMKSQTHLDESRSYINQLRSQSREEKRDRAMAALQISEGIALERESLVKQLDMLRDMNQRLRDDRDETELKRRTGTLEEELEDGERVHQVFRRDYSCESEVDNEQPNLKHALTENNNLNKTANSPTLSRGASVNRPQRRQLNKQGSVLSDYFGPPRSSCEEDDGIECDDDVIVPTSARGVAAMPSQGGGSCRQNILSLEQQIESQMIIEEEGTNSRRGSRYDTSDSEVEELRRKKTQKRYKRISAVKEESPHGSDVPDTSHRREPVGANSSVEPKPDLSQLTDQVSPNGVCPVLSETKELAARLPERIFKVVFVGDSGVGKSSFIHRFCNNIFKATFSATIGVDFQIRNVLVDNHVIALQLWDTAGQERFRSITKQYFRKADGVLIMYDVTAEQSFTNVRNWMESVQDGTEEGTVMVLVGNKIDLPEDDNSRVVTSKDGTHLADEFGALFFETSAKSGAHVTECIKGMASLLQEREDKHIENALKLADDASKKKGCCN